MGLIRLLPKSLHTVTVLENLTRDLMVRHGINDPENAIVIALQILQLSSFPDGYGLAAKALAKIRRA